MNDDVANVRPATAIGVWSIGALAVAAVALAGDRTFFREEPTTAARMTLVGLTLWLAIVWPMVAGDRLTWAYAAGHGAMLLLIAATTIGEALGTVGGWVAICGIAIGADRLSIRRATVWTVLVAFAVGGGAILMLRTSFGARG